MEFIAQHLRMQDRLEVAYSHHLDGESAVWLAWQAPGLVWGIDGDDGVPVGICGVSGTEIWLLATEGLLATPSHRRQFLRGGRKWVDGLLETHPLLQNWVFAKNEASVSWLCHLGFTVSEPAPRGPSAQLFRHFWRCAC